MSQLIPFVKRHGVVFGLRLGTFQHYAPRVLPESCRPADQLPDLNSDSSLPKLTIVTPCYNHANFLERTMLSVLGQGDPHLEYIVKDGGSDDGSVGIIKKYDEQLSSWTSGPDKGQADAIQQGLSESTGEIMAWINSDDYYPAGTFACVRRYFQDHPEVDVVYGHRIIVDPDLNEVGRWVLPPYTSRGIRWRCYIPQETMFWRRRIWEQVGSSLDTSYHHAMDHNLIVRFHQAGARFARLPRVMGLFTTHPEQKSLLNHDSVGRKEFALIREMLQADASAFIDSLGSASYLLQSIPWYWFWRLGLIEVEPQEK